LILNKAFAILLLGLTASCQQTPKWETSAKGLTGHKAATGALADVRLDGEMLMASAFAAEAAFLYPGESRALVHALFRAEFARLEGQRLQLQVSAAELEAAMQDSIAGLEASLPAGQSLDGWAQQRFDRNWMVVEGTLRRHLEQNQLFQLCARAHAWTEGRVELQMLTARDKQQADTWARQLRTGASASKLAVQSLDPGPNGDASLPPLPNSLPTPLGEWLTSRAAEPTADNVGGDRIFGPFQFEGDKVWRVVFVKRQLPAESEVPPVQVLLDDLRRQPVSPLEERAWFEAMAARYNAVENLPAIQAPAAAFVRNPTS
jgi:hypothetical protein